MRRAAYRVGATSLAFAVLALATPARADGPGDARLAQALFEEGRTLMDQKRFAEACPKLKESQRLDPGGGTLLNLASCHAGEGKTATALDEFHEALGVAQKDGRKDREQIARTNIEKLEREVPRVTVLVPHPVAGVEVKLDTTPLAPAAWGVAMPVDPGSHTVTSAATGYQSVRVVIDVKAGERKVIEVPAARKDAAEGDVPPSSTATLVEVTPATKKWNPVFWTVLGTAIAATVVGSATGIMYLDKANEAQDKCSVSRKFCSDGGEALSSAQSLWTVSLVSSSIGLAAFITLAFIPSKKIYAPSGQLGPTRTVGFRF